MDIVAVIERIEAHIKNLFENGAPHQKAHADDLQALTGYAKYQGGELSQALAQLEVANTKIAVLMTERDGYKADLDAANAEISALRGASADTAKENASLGIASTDGQTMADIKQNGLQMQTSGLPAGAQQAATSGQPPAAQPATTESEADPQNPNVGKTA